MREVILEKLIRDEDEVVSRFALGLIPDSSDAESLIETAASVLETREDAAFSEELTLLKDLVR